MAQAGTEHLQTSTWGLESSRDWIRESDEVLLEKKDESHLILGVGKLSMICKTWLLLICLLSPHKWLWTGTLALVWDSTFKETCGKNRQQWAKYNARVGKYGLQEVSLERSKTQGFMGRWEVVLRKSRTNYQHVLWKDQKYLVTKSVWWDHRKSFPSAKSMNEWPHAGYAGAGSLQKTR